MSVFSVIMRRTIILRYVRKKKRLEVDATSIEVIEIYGSVVS